MAPSEDRSPHVVIVGTHLDQLHRAPDTLIAGGWRDFGRPAAAVRRLGVRVAIVQAAWEDAEREVDGVPCSFVCEQGDPFVRLPGGWKFRRQPHRLLERVAALRPDLIHFEGLLFPQSLRALARAFPHVPILAQDHGTKCPRGLRRRWYRWGFRPLAAVAFTARAQAEPFTRAGVLREDIPIYEVIEGSSPFTPGDQAAARAATGLSGDPSLFWVGNLDANKDPLTVLDAVARASRTLPDLRLHMCFRHAPLHAAVQTTIAADERLAERVRLIGEVAYPGIELLFRSADFLVQASHAEGSGYGLIEALACGTTPLVTDIPSFRRITGDGACGALVPVDDPAALADAIVDWSRRNRAELRQRARAHFERELSFTAIGRQLQTAYGEVARRR